MKRKRFALHFILHAADLLDDSLRHRLAVVGVRPRQARIIDALARMEPASQIALAREFGITPASMSTMTARLIEAGHVMREVNPNEARAHLLRLTESGRGLLAEIHAAWRDIDQLIEDTIGAQGAAELTEHTRALRDGLGGHAPGTARPEQIADT
ncbi:MarR family winged helix-turn-helix transcriptional regulator [Paracoccus sp. Ld10]|uniref:MarR family winged helix-turn-helix transcriptional regulator n=1 Tax=Paracoccus sp. Ld10 TaxID=649158 RepID=UPI0038646882